MGNLSQVTALAPRKGVEFKDDEISLIKKQLMPPVKVKEKGEWKESPASDEELQLFLYVCKNKNLNPLTRQIYAMRNKEGKLTFMTSIDGLRIEANRTGLYEGQVGPLWCDDKGTWSDVWLGEGYPFAAKVGIYRKGFREPVWGIAKFKSYAQWKDEWKNGQPTGRKTLIGFWAKGDEHMLAKCAEAIALRRAFPEDIGGANALYIAEEAWAIQHDPNEETREEVLKRKLADLQGRRDAKAAQPSEIAVVAQEPPQLQEAIPSVVPEKAQIPPMGAVTTLQPEGRPEPPADSQEPVAEKFHVLEMELRKKAGKDYMWLKVGEGPMDVLSCWHTSFWVPPKEDVKGYLWNAKGRDCEFYIRTSKGYRNIEGIAKIGRRTFSSNVPDLGPDDMPNEQLEY